MNEKIINLQEAVRLMDWLKAKGFSSDEILECIKYISVADER